MKMEVHTLSHARWLNDIGAGARGIIIAHLREKLPPELIEKWRDQRRHGVPIGSDDPLFHVSTGMMVRNLARDVMPDINLPMRNWDEYYLGALFDLCAPPKEPPPIREY